MPTDTIESLRAELAAERETHRRLRESLAAFVPYVEALHKELRAALAPAEAGTHGEAPWAPTGREPRGCPTPGACSCPPAESVPQTGGEMGSLSSSSSLRDAEVRGATWALQEARNEATSMCMARDCDAYRGRGLICPDCPLGMVTEEDDEIARDAARIVAAQHPPPAESRGSQAPLSADEPTIEEVRETLHALDPDSAAPSMISRSLRSLLRRMEAERDVVAEIVEALHEKSCHCLAAYIETRCGRRLKAERGA